MANNQAVEEQDQTTAPPSQPIDLSDGMEPIETAPSPAQVPQTTPQTTPQAAPKAVAGAPIDLSDGMEPKDPTEPVQPQPQAAKPQPDTGI